VNVFTLAAFLCWFGGCGYLLARSADFGMFVWLAIATIPGSPGAPFCFGFWFAYFCRTSMSWTAGRHDIVGILGVVTGPVAPMARRNSVSQNGSRRFAPARSDAGVALRTETESRGHALRTRHRVCEPLTNLRRAERGLRRRSFAANSNPQR